MGSTTDNGNQNSGDRKDDLYNIFVSQREFDRLRADIHDDLMEIKDSISLLSSKIDQINQTSIPQLQTQTALQSVTKMDTKQKALLTGFISIVSIVITGLFAVIKALIGIP